MGEPVFVIKRKVLALNSIYTIYNIDDSPVYRISKSAFSLRTRLYVEALYNRDAFLVQGDLWGMEYGFYRYNKAFAMVSKKMWTFSGEYGLAVDDKEDEILIMSVVITIDLINRRKSS